MAGESSRGGVFPPGNRKLLRQPAGLLAAGLFAAGLLAAGCDSGSYPVAPTSTTESMVTLAVTANPTTITPDGSSSIEVLATQNNLPVRVGTEIRVTSTLGRITSELVATDQDGLAFTTLEAGGNIGDAMVQATSGSISSTMVKVTFGDTTLVGNFCWGGSELTAIFTDKTAVGSGKTLPFRWSWDFGDGGTSSEQNPVHVYAAEGTYLVTLTVANQGAEDSVSKFVTVPVTGSNCT